MAGVTCLLPAPAGGMLTALLCPPGRPVRAGADLAYIEPAIPGPGGGILLPWGPIRRRIADHMQYSNRTAAHITTGVEVDLARLQALRGSLQARGLSLSLTPFFVRAAAEALVEWPVLNGQITPTGLLLPGYVHIAMPVATPDGVHPVVLRDAPTKGVVQLAGELRYLTALARSGQAGALVTDGGTFTVTNPGSLGSVWGTAIINQPNCAILDCHAVVRRPVAVEGDRVAVRPMMNLSLTFDHRALDGAVTLGFLNRVKELLETAAVML